jgi:hypothetical protein
MDDTAAHLVDLVIPSVPVRQWVLSLPFVLRYRVSFDGVSLGAEVFEDPLRSLNIMWERRRGLKSLLAADSMVCGQLQRSDIGPKIMCNLNGVIGLVAIREIVNAEIAIMNLTIIHLLIESIIISPSNVW